MNEVDSKTIRVVFVSAWFTTGLPTIVFLGTMVLFVYGVFSYFDLMEGVEQRSILAEIGIGIGNLVGSVLAGIVVVVPTQKLLIALARLKKVSLTLEGTVLKCPGAKLDLRAEHSALVGAGVTPNGKTLTLINIEQGNQVLHLSLLDMVREQALEHFDDPRYVVTSVLSTEYGNAGYECDPEDPAQLEFMGAVLDLLSAHRDRNTRYQIYSAFPWDGKPNPGVSYVQEVGVEGEAVGRQVAALRREAEVSNEHFQIAGDYAVVEGSAGDSRSTFLVPLGHAVGAIEELHYTSTSTTSTTLKQKEVCVVSARDAQGAEVRITVATMPVDWLSAEYLQLAYFCQFISEMAAHDQA